MIPKGTTHEFWKSVHAGAIKASRELEVDIVYKGPLKEDDLKQQIDLVQSFTAQGVAGIVLAPLNDKALVASVRAATGSGIPVVIFDSDLQGDAHQSFVATDNRVAGRLAGERMAKLLDGKGGVLLLRYQEGSASTHHREEGFLEARARTPGAPAAQRESIRRCHDRKRVHAPARTSWRQKTPPPARSRACSARTNRRLSACCSRSKSRSSRAR